MLILSRRAEQQILFPHLGIRINVLQVKGQLVKLGVEAPRSIQVLRRELVESDEQSQTTPPAGNSLSHQLRNELNLLNLRIQALQVRLDRGESVQLDEALEQLLTKYSELDHSLQTTAPAAAAPHSGRPIRLMVVEDSPNERQLMAYLLASHGFDVQVATDGLVAIETLRSTERLPDFVLMDFEMPGANGLETLLALRTDDRLKHLKVFAVTGLARDPQNEPLGHGWDGWFRKPLDVPSLVSRLSAECSTTLQTVHA